MSGRKVRDTECIELPAIRNLKSRDMPFDTMSPLTGKSRASVKTPNTQCTQSSVESSASRENISRSTSRKRKKVLLQIQSGLHEPAFLPKSRTKTEAEADLVFFLNLFSHIFIYACTILPMLVYLSDGFGNFVYRELKIIFGKHLKIMRYKETKM